ncbi:MAG: hypothetical protein AB1762_22305, partial [Gemmatimonadota bacterium]
LLALHPPTAVAQTATPVADSAFATKGWAAALRLYEESFGTNPTNLTARVRAGYAALALQRLDVARTHFIFVVNLAPQTGAPYAHAGLSMVAARARDTAEALTRLESAVGAGYANYSALDQEEAYGSLRNNTRFVAARQRAEGNAYPCMADSVARSFDFWIGDWDVFLTGTILRVGRNVIERVAGGCAIMENWTASQGPVNPPSDGKSLNFVDPATGKWRQVFMGSWRAQTNYHMGEYVDGAMRFTYERTTPQGATVSGRFTFFNLGPNKVRQMQDVTRDGGQTYQIVYDFTYVRRGSGESP